MLPRRGTIFGHFTISYEPERYAPDLGVPVAPVAIDLHGAMTVDELGDGTTDLLRAVRFGRR